HAFIGQLLELIHVSRLIRISAHHYQRPIGIQSPVGFEDKLGIILRLQTRNIENVLTRGQAKLAEMIAALGWLGSISNHFGTLAVTLAIIVLDGTCISDDTSGRHGGK